MIAALDEITSPVWLNLKGLAARKRAQDYLKLSDLRQLSDFTAHRQRVLFWKLPTDSSGLSVGRYAARLQKTKVISRLDRKANA